MAAVSDIVPDRSSGPEAVSQPRPSGTESAAATDGHVPSSFHKGIAISVWQNSGGENSNWGEFVERPGACCGLFPKVMDRSSPNDMGSGFWERFREDIQLAKAVGVNAFRLSVEWHRIEPRPNEFDAAAIQRYHEIIDAIFEAGMTPNATLHHFVHPDWFEAKGGFEREENVPDFVRFCVRCAREFGRKVKLWSTFNEPTCALVCGWFLGVHPPGKVMSLVLMGRVLFNVLQAHAAVYIAMKAVPGCEDLQIGIVHHHVEFMPSSPHWAWIKGICWWGTFWWGRDTVLNYFKTGEFVWFVPLWGKTIDHRGPKPGLDWFGLNYYARGIVGPFLNPVAAPGELMTDMSYTIYPDGLYENLVRGSGLGVPMYVTEVGVADRSDDDHISVAHVDSFTKEVLRAIRDGYDVRGIYYWTLMDNFEWNAGYLMKFGIYYWSAEGKGKPELNYTLKPGGRMLAKFFSSIPVDMASLKGHCQTHSSCDDCEYTQRVKKAQKAKKYLPIVWNDGKCRSVAPLSPLHMRIGYQDLKLEGAALPPGEVEMAYVAS